MFARESGHSCDIGRHPDWSLRHTGPQLYASGRNGIALPRSRGVDSNDAVDTFRHKVEHEPRVLASIDPVKVEVFVSEYRSVGVIDHRADIDAVIIRVGNSMVGNIDRLEIRA